VNDDDFRQPGDLHGFTVRPSRRYRAEQHARGIPGVGIVKRDAASGGRMIGSVVDQDGESNLARRAVLPGPSELSRFGQWNSRAEYNPCRRAQSLPSWEEFVLAMPTSAAI